VVRKEGVTCECIDVSDMVVQVKQTYIPKYHSAEHDLSWASRGMVVSVLNGEAIPVLQRRIYDAGFDTLDIIPLGAEKDFLKTTDDREVSTILSEATYFFTNFFPTSVKWNKGIAIRERGA